MAIAIAGLAVAGPARAAEAGATFGDWQIECETPPDGKPQCFLSQTRVVPDQATGKPTRLIKVSAGYFGPEGKAVMVAILPLGIDLQAGAALRIDEAAPQALTLRQCLQEGCVANLALDTATLDALRTSKGAQIALLPYGGTQTIAIPVSTTGISDGLAALTP